jgi:integrase/recombinase XerD
MKQLRQRIIRLLENGEIKDHAEKEKLQFLLKTKKWNPYCVRHSSITADSDYLPEYALKKKVRWSMNSKQGTRYIKRRMGDELKNKILAHSGIITEQEVAKKPTILKCGRCSHLNPIEHKLCSTCGYPLTPTAYEEIKLAEDVRIRSLEEKYEKVSLALNNILSIIDRVNQADKNDIAKYLVTNGIYQPSK